MNSIIFRGRCDEPVPKVFLSDAVDEERLILDQSPGRGTRYGWKALSALYEASLTLCGYQVMRVARPEIYQTALARRTLGVGPGDWHLAVKPIEHLRPFHGIPNVFVCDWPFPELSASPLGGSPFFDQVRLLDMADAVLCCTDTTAATLRAAGVERVMTLPPHIPGLPQAQPSPLQTGQTFVCVADVDHLSRQLGPVVEGFAQARRDDLRLIVGLQGGDARAVADLRRRMAQENVSVVGDDAALLADVSFALSAWPAAGLHVPSVRAMRAGVPLVTTGSVLPADAVTSIATWPVTLAATEEPIARFMSLTAHAPSAASVRDAIAAAAALDPASRLRMAAAGRDAAERHFGLGAFQAGLDRLGAFVPLGGR